jgi:hypothetical protein
MRPLIPLTDFLATSVLLVGCAASNHPLARQSPSVALQVRQIAGCHQLVDGDRHLPEGFPASPVILLDSTRADPDESSTMMFAWVLPANSTARPPTTLSVWRVDPADANLIHLWLSDDVKRSGLTRLTLRRTADTLAGTVRGVADFPRFSLTHPARAIRVRCPE